MFSNYLHYPKVIAVLGVGIRDGWGRCMVSRILCLSFFWDCFTYILYTGKDCSMMLNQKQEAWEPHCSPDKISNSLSYVMIVHVPASWFQKSIKFPPVWAIFCKSLQPLHSNMHCDKFGWNWPSGSEEYVQMSSRWWCSGRAFASHEGDWGWYVKEPSLLNGHECRA